MAQITYRVEGMTCGGCVASLNRALQSALPGRQIEVVLEGGRVTIAGDHESSDVEDAVEGAGFDFVGAEA